MAKSNAAETKPATKFKVGDKVTVNGEPGEVVEVAAHDAHWLSSGCEQRYAVKLRPWTKVVKNFYAADMEEHTKVFYEHPVTKDRRDHESDTLSLPESAIQHGVR